MLTEADYRHLIGFGLLMQTQEVYLIASRLKNNRMIFVPVSKTPTGRRYIPMSDRVIDLLMVRCAGKSKGWVFPADSAAGHMIHYRETIPESTLRLAYRLG